MTLKIQNAIIDDIKISIDAYNKLFNKQESELLNKTIYNEKGNELEYINENNETYFKKIVFYSSREEYNNTLTKAFKIIREGVDSIVKDDNFEIHFMEKWSITPRQTINIRDTIEYALNLITKDIYKEWSSVIAYNIMYGIEGFLKSLIKVNIWSHIYDNLTEEQLSDLIYENIIWQLNEGDGSTTILDDENYDLFRFNCNKCSNNVSYVDDNDNCLDCSK